MNVLLMVLAYLPGTAGGGAMTTTLTPGIDLGLRSHHADRNPRWEQLPEDGNRYGAIDGVLCRATAPSAFHTRATGTFLAGRGNHGQRKRP